MARRIPEGGRHKISDVAVANHVYAMFGGLTDPTEKIRAVAIALCESGGYIDAVNYSPPREISLGLFQINILAHKKWDKFRGGEPVMWDPLWNVRAAREIYDNAGGSFARDWVNCYQKAGPGSAVWERAKTAIRQGPEKTLGEAIEDIGEIPGQVGGAIGDAVVGAIPGGSALISIWDLVNEPGGFLRVAMFVGGVLALVLALLLLSKDLIPGTIVQAATEAASEAA